MKIGIPKKYQRTNLIKTWYKKDKLCPFTFFCLNFLSIFIGFLIMSICQIIIYPITFTLRKLLLLSLFSLTNSIYLNLLFHQFSSFGFFLVMPKALEVQLYHSLKNIHIYYKCRMREYWVNNWNE